MEKGSGVESMVNKISNIEKIMVTGDRGYIGSVLVEKLISQGFNVVGLDTGFFESNIATGSNLPKYKQIKKDIRKVTLSDLEGIDAIIHLSALSNDPMGAIDPKLTEEINHKSSLRLAKLAKKVGVKRFIFSSSCSIYGIARSGVVDEKSKVNPLTAYARSKIKTERALGRLASNNFFVGLMRNSTVYGFSPSFRNDLVVNNLVTSALAFGELRIQSDGTPWRPLIDLRDLSNIFIEFLKTDNKNLNGVVLNIGFDNSNFQVKDIASTISQHLRDCLVVYTGEHGADSRSYRVKFDLFKKYFPQVSQKWPMSKSIRDMILKLKGIKFSTNDFKSGKYTRLAVLNSLIKKKKIDKNLYWKKTTRLR